MVPFIKIFLDDKWYRGASLSILEQLSVINTEEYMSIIVGALCSSTQGELHLKLDLLKVMSSPLCDGFVYGHIAGDQHWPVNSFIHLVTVLYRLDSTSCSNK